MDDKLRELVAGRGKKGTDRSRHIESLTELRQIAAEAGLGEAHDCKILFAIVAAIFDYNPNIATSMKADIWEKYVYIITVIYLSFSPTVSIVYLININFVLSITEFVAAWLSGSALVLISVVALRRAQLVLGWVTVLRYNTLVFNQSHPGLLSLAISVGRCNEYWLWSWPPLGKKWRVLHNSRPCYHNCWHTGLVKLKVLIAMGPAIRMSYATGCSLVMESYGI